MFFYRFLVALWFLQGTLSFVSHPYIRHIKYPPTPPPILNSRQVTTWKPIPSQAKATTTQLSLLSMFGGIELKNLVYDDVSTAFDAWEVSVRLETEKEGFVQHLIHFLTPHN